MSVQEISPTQEFNDSIFSNGKEKELFKRDRPQPTRSPSTNAIALIQRDRPYPTRSPLSNAIALIQRDRPYPTRSHLNQSDRISTKAIAFPQSD